jgi:hypothetical protein
LHSICSLLSANQKEEKVISEAVQLELPLFEEDNQDFQELDYLQRQEGNAVKQIPAKPETQAAELLKSS